MSEVEFYNPDSWMDIVDHVWIGLVLLAIAAIPSWFALRNHQSIQELKSQGDQIVGQVTNGHGDAPPLRADIDRAISGIDNISKDVHRLREDLAEEREERHRHVAELRSEITWNREEISRRLGDIDRRHSGGV